MNKIILAAVTLAAFALPAHAESCGWLRDQLDYVGTKLNAADTVAGENIESFRTAKEMNDVGSMGLYASLAERSLYSAITFTKQGIDYVDRMKAKGGCFEFTSTLNSKRAWGEDRLAHYRSVMNSIRPYAD